MKSLVSQQIPAGILDDSFELFSQGSNQYCMAEGKRWDYPFFPLWVLKIIEADMQKHPLKVEELAKAGVTSRLEQVRWYIHCCFGGFDGQPDYVNGELVHTEYFECGQRGNCPYEGKICSSIVHQYSLTPREIDTVKLLHEGFQDKEIADKLNIKTSTVSVHVKKTIKKLALGNRSDVVRFASDHHILLNP